MTRARVVWVSIAAVCLAVGVVVVVKATGKPAAPQFVTQAVERGPVVSRVTATGTLSALITVQVGAQVSGRITKLGADFNSQVKKGDMLVELDPSLLEANLAQARANETASNGNLLRAKAQALDATRKLERAQQLADQKLISQAERDTALAERDMAQASVTAAEGQLAQARANRNQAQVNLTYATIHSPIDGTVISRAVDVGQTVAASLQAPTLFTIAESLTSMQVDTNVAEADVGKLSEGLEATFSVDAFPGRTFRGKIRQIRFAPIVVSNVVTYDAVIDVPNPDLLLRPGMTANVTFTTARADDVLRIPNAALRFKPSLPEKDTKKVSERRGSRPDGGVGGPRDFAKSEKIITVLRGEQVVQVKIETGLTDGSSTEVKSGELQEGDLVVVDQAGADGQAPRPPGGGQGMGGMRRMF